jgi:hypothetical protein
VSEIRYYTVIEQREMKVAAHNPTQAINLATAVFAGREVNAEEGISILKPIAVRSIEAREDY